MHACCWVSHWVGDGLYIFRRLLLGWLGWVWSVQMAQTSLALDDTVGTQKRVPGCP